MNKYKKYLIPILILALLTYSPICYAKTNIVNEIKNRQLILKERGFELQNDEPCFKDVPLKYNDRGICILTYHCIGL